MFRGGKYNPSEISALNVFTMFWTNHPLLNNFVHILITSIIYGIMGMFCCATSFYFRNRKTVYFVSIFFWLIEILKPGSLLRTNSIAFLCKYAIVKLNIYLENIMLPINYLHERKTMIKSKKNTIGIVKDTICKIDPEKSKYKLS